MFIISPPPGQLAYLAQIVNAGNDLAGKTIKLKSDLDLSGKAWTPIGNYSMFPLAATFDGNGHTVTGLTTDYYEDSFGLIGCTTGEIKNVTLKEPKLKHIGGEYSGTLAGYAEAPITDCHVIDCDVDADEDFGGLVGYLVKYYDYDGVDMSGVCILNHCSVSGTIHSLGNVGGIARYVKSDYDMRIADCAFSGQIECSSGAGIVNTNYCSIERCYCEGTITATNMAGGIAGERVYASIKDCYSICDLVSSGTAGGIVGDQYYMRDAVTNCYAAGNVSANNDSGILFGGVPSRYDSFSAENCYWYSGAEMELQGLPASAVGMPGTDCTTALTLAQMKDKENFAGFDFETVWGIDPEQNGGLPFFRWQEEDSQTQEVYEPATIKLNMSSARLTVGKSVWLEPAFEPVNASGDVVWSTSDETVATVAGGQVIGVGVGDAIITATVKGTTLKTTCKVVVAESTEIPTLTVGSVVGRIGSTVQVPVSLEYNPGVTTVGFAVEYDQTALTLVGYENGDIFSDGELYGNVVKNPFEFTALNGSEDRSENGVLVFLTFKVLDDTEIGYYPITISNAEAYNLAENTIDVVAVSGRVTATEFAPGDVNGDGEVHPDDLLRLTKYFSGYDVEIDQTAADVTGDGVLNRLDLTRLAKYFAGYDVVLSAALPEEADGKNVVVFDYVYSTSVRGKLVLKADIVDFTGKMTEDITISTFEEKSFTEAVLTNLFGGAAYGPVEDRVFVLTENADGSYNIADVWGDETASETLDQADAMFNATDKIMIKTGESEYKVLTGNEAAALESAAWIVDDNTTPSYFFSAGITADGSTFFGYFLGRVDVTTTTYVYVYNYESGSVEKIPCAYEGWDDEYDDNELWGWYKISLNADGAIKSAEEAYDKFLLLQDYDDDYANVWVGDAYKNLYFADEVKKIVIEDADNTKRFAEVSDDADYFDYVIEKDWVDDDPDYAGRTFAVKNSSDELTELFQIIFFVPAA